MNISRFHGESNTDSERLLDQTPNSERPMDQTLDSGRETPGSDARQ